MNSAINIYYVGKRFESEERNTNRQSNLFPNNIFLPSYVKNRVDVVDKKERVFEVEEQT